MVTYSYPASSLLYSLAGRTVAELRGLAKSYCLKGCSRMRKSALIETLFHALLDMDRLMEVLYLIDPPAWELFQQVAAEGLVEVDDSTSPQYQLLVDLGYLMASSSQSETYLSMPDEIKAVYADLAAGGLPEQKRRFDLIHAYALAVTNFYGVISLGDFEALFNSQNEEKAGLEEILSALRRHIPADATYCVWEGYLVNEAFQDNSRQRVAAHLAQVGRTPRYLPCREELLRYRDASYFEETAHTRRLERYLVEELGQKAGAARELVTLIHYAFEAGTAAPAANSILSSRGITLQREQQAEAARMIQDVFRTTRTSRGNGHTPDELKQLKTMGRNDPCPCGSGIKYKKCCGR